MTRIRKMRAGTLAALTVPAIVGATLLLHPPMQPSHPAHTAATPPRTALTLSTMCMQTVLTGQNPWA